MCRVRYLILVNNQSYVSNWTWLLWQEICIKDRKWNPSRPGYNFYQNGQVRYSWWTSVNPGESCEMFRRWLDYGILKNRIVLVHEIGCCRNHFWVWVNVKKRSNNMYKDKRRRICKHPNKWYTWVVERWFCNWPCPSWAFVKHFVASGGFFKNIVAYEMWYWN